MWMEKEYTATCTSISNLLAGLYCHCWAYNDNCPNFMNRKNPVFKDLNGACWPLNMIVSSQRHFVQGSQASCHAGQRLSSPLVALFLCTRHSIELDNLL